VIRASLFDWQADARVKPAHDVLYANFVMPEPPDPPTSSCPDRRDSGVIRASLFDWQADARVKPAHDGFW
jgi:hypothetical protein